MGNSSTLHGTTEAGDADMAATTQPDPRRQSPQTSVTLIKDSVRADNIAWLRHRFIAFDTETTGLYASEDRIVELGATLFEDGRPTRSYSTLVNPGIPIPAEATAVNHITNAMLRRAPGEREAFSGLLAFLEDAALGVTALVAHNARFDMSFMNETLTRLGMGATLRHIDTLSLARSLVSGVYDYRQATLTRHFGIRNAAEHRAEGDARACGYLFLRLLDTLDASGRFGNDWLSEEERQVCAFVQHAISGVDDDTYWLGFHRSHNYVDVSYVLPFLRFKVTRRKRYVLVDRQDAPQGIRIEACAANEGPHDHVHLVFEGVFDLEPLVPYIRARYLRCKALATWHGTMQSPRETTNHAPASTQRRIRDRSAWNGLSDEDVEQCLKGAREAWETERREREERSAASVLLRSQVEIAPVRTREPRTSIRNADDALSGITAGQPYWSRGEELRKAGDIEAALQLFDHSRLMGYVAPELYESYGKAFRKLGELDDEIAILDEGIERIGGCQPLEDRRDKAVSALIRKRRPRRGQGGQGGEGGERKRRAQAADGSARLEVKSSEVSGLDEARATMGSRVAGGRAVVQLDDDLCVVAIYATVAEASESTGVGRRGIRDAARGRQRHAGGFVWRYEDEL